MGGRYRRALETFRTFGERYKEGLFIEEAYYEWALMALEAGQPAKSIEILLPSARRAETLNNPGQVITLLGEAYFANAEYTRAMEAFDIAEELENIDPALKHQARFQRGWIQYSNQAYQQAQTEFEEDYGNAPEDATLRGEALFWSADSYYETRNYGPAARNYARFIDENPDHELMGAAKYGMAWSYIKVGVFEQAISPFMDFRENYETPLIELYLYEIDLQLRIGDYWLHIDDI